MDSLGDRIKRYEKVTRSYATQKVPLIIRVDGKAFHTFTKDSVKPFDPNLMRAMVDAATFTAETMQGFKLAYVQSDEATFLLTDYDQLETQGWFDYNLSKIISISAAKMSVEFNVCYGSTLIPAVFDSRAFNVPANDVSNVFLWRAKDWERNSLQMYCRSIFSHKELHGKNREDMHKMLASKGKSWFDDLTDQEKFGTFIYNTEVGLKPRQDISPSYASVNQMIENFV